MPDRATFDALTYAEHITHFEGPENIEGPAPKTWAEINDHLGTTASSLPELVEELDHPFEHEEKLTVATKRQQEIVSALDITKNQASAKLDEGAEQATESVEEAPVQWVRSKRTGSA